MEHLIRPDNDRPNKDVHFYDNCQLGADSTAEQSVHGYLLQTGAVDDVREIFMPI